MLIDIPTHLTMISTTALVNTSIMLHSYHFTGAKTLKIYSLTNFQISSTVLTMLCIRHPKLTYLVTWHVHPLASISPVRI